MITIRKVETYDLAQLSEIFDAYRVFYNKNSAVQEASAFLFERIKNNDSKIFVAELDEALVGFVQLYPLFSSTQMKRLWLLNDLFVKPEFRGQKISVGLIDKAKELAISTKAAGLMLETEKSNIIGNVLYPKTSFKLDSEHNFYFWDAS